MTNPAAPKRALTKPGRAKAAPAPRTKTPGQKADTLVVRELKHWTDTTMLSVHVIVQKQGTVDRFADIENPILEPDPSVFTGEGEPEVCLCFDADEAEQCADEFGSDALVDAGYDPADFQPVWRDGKVPSNMEDLKTRCWHVDLVKDGTVIARDFTVVYEPDITDLIADMPDEIMDAMKEIRAEADDIDLVIASTPHRTRN